jgi:hypothetical protein
MGVFAPQMRHADGMRLCAIVLLLAARGAFAADTLLSDYAPPETRVVLGIRLRNILNAIITSDEIKELRVKTAAVMAQSGFPGFDPFIDLDELLVATSGAGEKVPSIAILRGRFDVDRLAGTAPRYHGIPVIDNKQGSDSVTALLDSSTAIAGPLALVHAAIDNRGGAAHLSPKLAARSEELRARYDIWGTADQILPSAQTGGQANPFGGIDRFDFGAAFHRNLELTAEFHARTPKDAEEMRKMVDLLKAMVQGAKSTPSATRFDMRLVSSTLKISLIVPESELKKTVRTQRASLESALLSQLAKPQPAASPKPAPPPPAPPRALSDAKGNTVTVTLPGGH